MTGVVLGCGGGLGPLDDFGLLALMFAAVYLVLTLSLRGTYRSFCNMASMKPTRGLERARGAFGFAYGLAAALGVGLGVVLVWGLFLFG